MLAYMTDLQKIGKLCKYFRRGIGKTQLNVGFDLNYSPESISSFECGHNDSIIIFLWYLRHGLPIEKIMGEVNNHEHES